MSLPSQSLRVPSSKIASDFVTQINQVILFSSNTTVQGLLQEINEFGHYVMTHIKNHDILTGRSSIFIQSTFAIFYQHINKNFPEAQGIQEVKQKLHQIGEQFATNLL